MTRLVITTSGYETTCRRHAIEALLREQYAPPMWFGDYGRANLTPRYQLPWLSYHQLRLDGAVIGNADELAQLRCADGIEQCEQCVIQQVRRRWRAVMDAVPPGACVYCGEPDARSVDHRIARAENGAHEEANLVRACQSCNSSKGKLPLQEWLRSDRERAAVARYHAKVAMPGQLAFIDPVQLG